MNSSRIERLQKWIEAKRLDALIIETPMDLYYLLHLELSLGTLVVTPTEAYLLVDGRYFEQCKAAVEIPVILSKGDALADLFKTSLQKIKNIGFIAADTSYERFEQLKEMLPRQSLVPTEKAVEFLRMIKDAEELDLLRKAAKLCQQGFAYAISLLKPGVSEKEIAAEVEIFWKRHGADGLSFPPIIAFGEASSMPHYRAGEAVLKGGQHVLLDMGVTLDGYQSDMTRVHFLKGSDPLFQELYEIVQEAQQAALAICRPGTKVGDLDGAARKVIAAAGYGDYFMHSLGHGIGLEVHEMPTLRAKVPERDRLLEEGMVVTIEPGIYLPGRGGVRFEDTVILCKGGHELITR